MPYCKSCGSYEFAVLQVKLPETLKKKLKLKKAFLCFECIKTKARNCLDPNGYWFQFVFPHMMPVHRRYKGV